MDSKLLCIVVCALLSLCDSAYVDTINKCSFKDDECVAKTIQSIVKYIGRNGIKELNIPAVDPLDLSGLSVPVFEMLVIRVLEGSITGVKDCVFNHIHNDFDALVTDMDLTCDVAIKAKFKLEDISPIAQKLFGAEATSGSGSLRLKIDKIHMKLKFFVQIIKKDDGEIYIVPNNDNIASAFDIEKLTLTADKILFGDHDLTEIVEKLFNENWKSLLPTFGNSIFEVAISIVKTFLGDFFNNVPAKNYYIDDLTSYVKNSK